MMQLLLLLAISTAKLSAQLCTGSLGEPAVSIDFGSGKPGDPAYKPTTTYGYLTNSCPGDGWYSVVRQTSGCYGNTWLTVNEDHTGDGAFMLVNGSFTPGDFFIDTVQGLCQNTTYQFSVWLLNVLAITGNKPNLTITIESPDSTVFQTYNTGDIPEEKTAIWKEYGFFFTTPLSNQKLVIRMRNNAPGGKGNDLAIDDISFRACGEKLEAAVAGFNSDSVDLCSSEKKAVTLSGYASPSYTSPIYQWQTSIDKGNSWQDIPGGQQKDLVQQNGAAAGNYYYRFTVTEANSVPGNACRIVSNVVTLNIHESPSVDAGPAPVVIKGSAAQLQGSVSDPAMSFIWYPTDNMQNQNSLTPTINPLADQLYTLTGTDTAGCVATDSVFVKVIRDFYVPSGFTPNGDGKNDHWRIPFLVSGVKAAVTVYNRWGAIVYQSNDGWADWDGNFKGQPQAAGTYIYLIRFQDASFGTLKGTVTIIR